MSKPTNRKINLFPIFNLTVFGLLFLLAAIILINLQFIKDHFVVWTNPISAETSALVQTGGMNEKGRFYYAASLPKLAEADEFNQVCRDNHERSVAILGCYTNQQIYIYNITDERLDGVREVTAVHESLHAVYDRLSAGEKNYVNGLLDKEYASLTDDKELTERMAYYQKTEPGQFHNELHSIIATEKPEISRSLEEYYSKYFDDRQEVVAIHKNYSSTIRSLSDKADSLNQQIAALKVDVEARVSQYNADVANVSQSITTFNTLANTEGHFKNQAEFNASRQRILNQTIALDRQYLSIQADIARHDELINEYNDIAITADEINRSLNSALTPAPSL